MTKKLFNSLLIFSFLIHILFICCYPLTADELNVYKIFNFHSADFSSFWKYFIQYDTHQPLFHLMWYPVFRADFSVFIYRLPSLMFFAGSVLVWKKLFSHQEKKNIIPWVLFLFCPFVTIYSGLFLPYSLLIFASLINYYFFLKLEAEPTKKHTTLFMISALVLMFTHYYGALQAILLAIYLVYKGHSKKHKIMLLSAVIGLVLLLFMATDLVNDFNVVHSYRKAPTLLAVLGYLNLLLGGVFSATVVLVLLAVKKKAGVFKTREFYFIAAVLSIAILKSVFISPSLEARYLLILIYPLYALFKDVEVKLIIPVLIISCLVSFYILEKKFSPTFVLDYRNIKKDDLLTALVITPCPKYYFQEENYICTKVEIERIRRSFDKALVHIDHIENFSKTAPDIECIELQKGLYSCIIPPFHF